MAGPAINIRLHNTKREPAGFCQRPPEPPSPMRGGREEAGTALPTAPRAPAVGGAPGQPTDPQTSTAPPPNRGGCRAERSPAGPARAGGTSPKGLGPPRGRPPPPVRARSEPRGQPRTEPAPSAARRLLGPLPLPRPPAAKLQKLRGGKS